VTTFRAKIDKTDNKTREREKKDQDFWQSFVTGPPHEASDPF
jgi:hypothetical protein